MSATGNVGRVSRAGVSKSAQHKPYSPTEKKNEYLSVVRAADEISEHSGDKLKDEEQQPDNAIATKTTVIIDEKNQLNTDSYLQLMNSSKQVFKYSERHSIGKKFVSDKLI